MVRVVSTQYLGDKVTQTFSEALYGWGMQQTEKEENEMRRRALDSLIKREEERRCRNKKKGGK